MVKRPQLVKRNFYLVDKTVQENNAKPYKAEDAQGNIIKQGYHLLVKVAFRTTEVPRKIL